MFSSGTALDSPYEKLAEAYMEEFPNVSITINRQPLDTYDTTLRTQLQAGSASDLVQTAPGAGQLRSVVALADAGFLAPLADSSAAVIPEGSESLLQIDGETFGQPVDYTVTGLLTNSTAQESSGIGELSEDFDDFLTQCAELSEQGLSMIALTAGAGPNAGYSALLVSTTMVYAETPDWDAQRAAGETTFAGSEGWRDTLDAFVRLNEAGCFQPGASGAGLGTSASLLASGQGLTYIAPSVAIVEIQSGSPDTEFAINPFPGPAGGAPNVLASSNFSLSITAGSKNQEAAQAFLDWMSEPAQGELWTEYSGSLSVTGYADVNLDGTPYEPIADLLAAGTTTSLPILAWPNPRVFDELITGAQGLLTGQRTADQILAAMDAAWDA